MEDKFRDKYVKYKNKYLNLKKIEQKLNIQSGGSQNKKEIYLFKAEWCGHCQAFKSTWKDLESTLNKKYDFKVYDADKNKNEIKKWQIRGFPTIIAKSNNSATEYVGPRDYDSLANFFKSV